MINYNSISESLSSEGAKKGDSRLKKENKEDKEYFNDILEFDYERMEFGQCKDFSLTRKSCFLDPQFVVYQKESEEDQMHKYGDSAGRFERKEYLNFGLSTSGFFVNKFVFE